MKTKSGNPLLKKERKKKTGESLLLSWLKLLISLVGPKRDLFESYKSMSCRLFNKASVSKHFLEVVSGSLSLVKR